MAALQRSVLASSAPRASVAPIRCPCAAVLAMWQLTAHRLRQASLTLHLGGFSQARQLQPLLSCGGRGIEQGGCISVGHLSVGSFGRCSLQPHHRSQPPELSFELVDFVIARIAGLWPHKCLTRSGGMSHAQRWHALGSQDAPIVSRRDAMALSAAAVLSLSAAAPAKAFLGFGDDGEQIKTQYTDETVCVACMQQ